MDSKSKYSLLSVYSSIISLLYLIYGIIEVVNGAVSWWLPWIGELNVQIGVPVTINEFTLYVPNSMSDPFAGLVLIILSTIFLRAALKLRKVEVEAWSFTVVGLLLSGILAGLDLLIIFADFLDSYYPIIFGGEAAEWAILTDEWFMNPMFVLFILAIPLIKVYWMKEELM